LSLIGGVPGKAVPPAASSSAPAAADNRPTEPIGRRRALVPATDTPVFEATAVGAWVAETAAARARETEARAAAVLAAEAAKREAAKGEATAASPAGPGAGGADSGEWSATGLRRADSPRLGGTDASAPAAGVTKTPSAATVEPAEGKATAPDAKTRSIDPESTAPAPPRPTAPHRPTVPAPARPAPPPRPTPDPTPSRPAATAEPAAKTSDADEPATQTGVKPSVAAPSTPAASSRPAAAAEPAAKTSYADEPAAKTRAGVQQPLAAPSTPVASGRSASSGGQSAPVTSAKEGQSHAPVHVSISDRPAVVSQPGSSIPGRTSEPPTGTVPRPAVETPRTTTEIQARLQAAMKPSSRVSGEPPSSADALRVGVAGRRDYPASTRRDNASGSTGAGRPTATATGDAPKAGEKVPAAAHGGSHIAEQRVDADQPRQDAASTEAGGKEKPRRTAGKTTKADRTKSAKPTAAAASVPGARLSAYAEEAAELLAGLSPDRRRRKEDDTPAEAKETGSTRKEPAKD
jgi:hypothetical protein